MSSTNATTMNAPTSTLAPPSLIVTSSWNIGIFSLLTVLYSTVLRPKPTSDTYNSPETASKSNRALFIYFGLILLSQFFINAQVLSNTLGGNIGDYLGPKYMFYTIIPWTFLFGIIILVMYFFPGFKSAFSDIIGYYWVSSDANEIFNKLLKNAGSVELESTSAVEGKGVSSSSSSASSSSSSSSSSSTIENVGFDSNKPVNFNDLIEDFTKKPKTESDIKRKIKNTIGFSPESVKNIDMNDFIPVETKNEAAGVSEKTTTLDELQSPMTKEQSIDLITKICGNPSVLINQILPSNFNTYWDAMSKALFKVDVTGQKGLEQKEELFKLVLTRDNIGESMWFFYTGLLVACIVQFKLTTINPKA